MILKVTSEASLLLKSLAVRPPVPPCIAAALLRQKRTPETAQATAYVAGPTHG